MTSGALIQIVAVGAQDAFLTAQPTITYFKIMYRRHTNFAMESIEQPFGSIGFGRKATVTIPKSGDLVSQILLKLRLPEVRYPENQIQNMGHVTFAWVRNIGHAAIDDVEFEIGAGKIDTHYGDWLQIWQDLTASQGQKRGLAKMLGDVPELTSLSSLSWHDHANTFLKPAYDVYVPLQFYFCRNIGLALPLIALQYHECKIALKLRHANELYIASDAFKEGGVEPSLAEASLYINYIFLDTDERKRHAVASHETLIDQLQNTGEETINNSSSGKYRLAFNHPVKAIYWITKLGNYRGGKFMIYNDRDWDKAREDAAKLLLLAQFDLDNFGFFNPLPVQTSGDKTYLCDQGNKYTYVDPDSNEEEHRFSYSDSRTAANFGNGHLIGRLSFCQKLLSRKDVDLRNKVDGIIRISSDSDESNNYFFPVVERITRNDLTIADLSIPIDKFDQDHRNNFIKRFDVTVWQHDNYGLLIDGSVTPFTNVELQLNGSPRQGKRSGFWHDTIVPYLHHTNTPRDGLGVFSFALFPESPQPSGACNMSRIDTAQLNLTFRCLSSVVSPKFAAMFQGVIENVNNKLAIFARNVNVLRAVSGMGGIAYAN